MTTTQLLLEPRLPQDLEQTIFEMAARSERRRIPQLMLVARRVRDWLEPMLFEILIVHDESPQSKIQCYRTHVGGRFPSGPQKRHVRQLLDSKYPDLMSRRRWEGIIPECYNIQHLAIWSFNPSLPDLELMINSRLRTVTPRGLLRLSATLSSLFPDGVDFNHPILKDLTHLDIMDDSEDSEFMKCWQEGNNLGCLKKLKYLRFSAECPASMEYPIFDLIAKCLEECNSLELLLVIDFDEEEINATLENLSSVRRRVSDDGTAEEVPEDRVVFLNKPNEWYEEWTNEAMGRDDLWTTGERIVEERRRKGANFQTNPSG